MAVAEIVRDVLETRAELRRALGDPVEDEVEEDEEEEGDEQQATSEPPQEEQS